jgi:hypothetical protein
MNHQKTLSTEMILGVLMLAPLLVSTAGLAIPAMNLFAGASIPLESVLSTQYVSIGYVCLIAYIFRARQIQQRSNQIAVVLFCAGLVSMILMVGPVIGLGIAIFPASCILPLVYAFIRSRGLIEAQRNAVWI